LIFYLRKNNGVYIHTFTVKNNGLSIGFCRTHARKNPRSDGVFLDFLFLLYQDKRKGKGKATAAMRDDSEGTN